MIQATGQVIFISYFFSPSNDDRCFSADSGWAIQLGPSMIRMLGPFCLCLKDALPVGVIVDPRPMMDGLAAS